MSNIVTGEVQIVSAKGPAVNIKLSTGDWYGCGFTSVDKLKFKQGDTISFSFSENGKFKNIDLKSVEVQAKAATPSAPASGGGGGSTNWDQKNKQDAEKQLAISVQSCRNSAIEVVKMLKELDALPLGSKKQDIAGNLEKYVDDLTDRYFKDTQALAAGKSRAQIVQSEQEFE